MSVEILTPASRAEWLGLRGKTIGASEVAALLGCHPYTTAYEMFCLKSGLLTADPAETGPMRRGRHLEAVAVEFLREERPTWTINANAIPGGRLYRDAELGLSCTPDAFAADPEREGIGIVQIKSVEPSVFRTKWKSEDVAVEPPLFIVLQAIQEAYLTGASWAVVCPLVIGFAIEMPVIEIPLHAGIIDRLKSEAAAFWRGVEGGRAPDPDMTRDGALLEQMWTGAVPEIDLSGDNKVLGLVEERERLSADKGAAEKRLKEIKTELLLKVGDASRARLADGRIIETKRVDRAGYEVKPTSYVDLRVKTPRENRRAA